VCPFSEEDGQEAHGRISFVEPSMPLGARLQKCLTGFEGNVVAVFEFDSQLNSACLSLGVQSISCPSYCLQINNPAWL
jgi:hypothetical protein